MKPQRAIVALAVVALLAAAGSHAWAAPIQKGSSILSFGVASGDADLISPAVFYPGSGRATAYDHSEWGGQAQYQYLVSSDWAMAASFRLGTFKETDEPGTNSPANIVDKVYKQTSWQARLGVDRFVHISSTFHLYCGPGVHVWSGKAKFTEEPSTIEAENTTRVALDGRIGAHVALGSSVMMTGELGRYAGHASGTDGGSKVTWWPSGAQGSMGLSFVF